jgi:hypothetical protein
MASRPALAGCPWRKYERCEHHNSILAIATVRISGGMVTTPLFPQHTPQLFRSVVRQSENWLPHRV